MGGGGQGLEYWRGGGGAGGGIPSRHIDVIGILGGGGGFPAGTSTSFRRHVPTRFLINQCQIITFLILKVGSCPIDDDPVQKNNLVFFLHSILELLFSESVAAEKTAGLC